MVELKEKDARNFSMQSSKGNQFKWELEGRYSLTIVRNHNIMSCNPISDYLGLRKRRRIIGKRIGKKIPGIYQCL